MKLCQSQISVPPSLTRQVVSDYQWDLTSQSEILSVPINLTSVCFRISVRFKKTGYVRISVLQSMTRQSVSKYQSHKDLARQNVSEYQSQKATKPVLKGRSYHEISFTKSWQSGLFFDISLLTCTCVLGLIDMHQTNPRWNLWQVNLFNICRDNVCTMNSVLFIFYPPASPEKDDLEMSYRNCGMQKCWCNFLSDVGISECIPIFRKFIETFPRLYVEQVKGDLIWVY